MPTFDEITRHHDADPSENPWVLGPPAPAPVTIVPYDPRWPGRYETLAAGIRTALGDAVLDVEHVGSTSVEGLAAKDVIDINLTVADPRTRTGTSPRSNAPATSSSSGSRRSTSTGA
nr:GrpB family protein [Saccharothrix sp. NRRL B-16314]